MRLELSYHCCGGMWVLIPTILIDPNPYSDTHGWELSLAWLNRQITLSVNN